MPDSNPVLYTVLTWTPGTRQRSRSSLSPSSPWAAWMLLAHLCRPLNSRRINIKTVPATTTLHYRIPYPGFCRSRGDTQSWCQIHWACQRCPRRKMRPGPCRCSWIGKSIFIYKSSVPFWVCCKTAKCKYVQRIYRNTVYYALQACMFRTEEKKLRILRTFFSVPYPCS